MRGRTSRYTAGRVNSIVMTVAHGDIDIDIGPFEETIIISTTPYTQFSLAGDSGSFIYNSKGQIVALQTAESFPAEQFRVHYSGVTPIRQIFQDIARQCSGVTARLCSGEDMSRYNIPVPTVNYEEAEI